MNHILLSTFFFFTLCIYIYISYSMAPSIQLKIRHYQFLNRKKVRKKKKVQSKKEVRLFNKWMQSLDQQIKAASLPIKANELLLILFWGNIITFLINWLLFQIFIAFFLSIILNGTLYIILKILKRKRKTKMAEQLPEVLELISNSLKSGYSINQTFELISKENFHPLSDEFVTLVRSISFGTSMDNALNEFSENIDIEEIKIFVDTVLITKETGGNLTHVIDQLYMMLREKKSLQKELKALTSQGRISGIIVGSMPIVLSCVLWFINPDYINVLFSNKIGNLFIGISVVLQVIGIIVMRNIIQLKGR